MHALFVKTSKNDIQQ